MCDETERTKPVVVKQRSYIVPADVAHRIEQLERELSASRSAHEEAYSKWKEAERELAEANTHRIAYDGTIRLAQEYRERAEAAERRAEELIERCAQACIDMPQPDGSTYTYWPCVNAIRALKTEER